MGKEKKETNNSEQKKLSKKTNIISKELSSESLASSPTTTPPTSTQPDMHHTYSIIPEMHLNHSLIYTTVNSRSPLKTCSTTMQTLKTPKKFRTISSRPVLQTYTTPACSSSTQIPLSIFNPPSKYVTRFKKEKQVVEKFKALTFTPSDPCEEFEAKIDELNKKNLNIKRVFFGTDQSAKKGNVLDEIFTDELCDDKGNILLKSKLNSANKFTRLLNPSRFKRESIDCFNQFYDQRSGLQHIVEKSIIPLFTIFNQIIDKKSDKTVILKDIKLIGKGIKSELFSHFIRSLENYIDLSILRDKITDPKAKPYLFLVCIQSVENILPFKRLPLKELYPPLDYNKMTIQILSFLSIIWNNKTICKFFKIPVITCFEHFEHDIDNLLFIHNKGQAIFLSYKQLIETNFVLASPEFNHALDNPAELEMFIENYKKEKIEKLEKNKKQASVEEKIKKDKQEISNPISSLSQDLQLAIYLTLAFRDIPKEETSYSIASTIDAYHLLTRAFFAYIKTTQNSNNLMTSDNSYDDTITQNISCFMQCYLRFYFSDLEENTKKSIILFTITLYHCCKSFDQKFAPPKLSDLLSFSLMSKQNKKVDIKMRHKSNGKVIVTDKTHSDEYYFPPKPLFK